MKASRIRKGATALALIASFATAIVSGVAEAQASGGKSAPAQATTAPADVVDINTASEVDLERLPGIGPSRAKAIVALREQMKGFHRVEDLMRVKGIGRKTFQKLSSLVTLGTTPDGRSAKH